MAEQIKNTVILQEDTRPTDEAIEENRYAHHMGLIRLAQVGDGDAMERLVVENMGLVRSVAVKFRDRGTEMEDLIQIGTLGMIKAIRSFDCGRGTAFSTYAVPLIVGEIRRHLRDDGLVRVSRGYRHLGMLLLRERTRIAAEEGREATIGELATACGVTREEAATALDALSPVASLSDNAYGEDSPELGAIIPAAADGVLTVAIQQPHSVNWVIATSALQFKSIIPIQSSSEI